MPKKPKTYKALLIYGIIFLFLICCFFFYLSKNKPGDYSVEIVTKNETIVQPLHKNQIIQVEGLLSQVIIELNNSSVKVIESGCPDKICIKAGNIRIPGPMIICAPNHVVVRIIQKRLIPLLTY